MNEVSVSVPWLALYRSFPVYGKGVSSAVPGVVERSTGDRGGHVPVVMGEERWFSENRR